MPGRIHAVGGRVVFEHAFQDAFGTPKIPERRLRLTVPEGLKAEREFTESEEPSPQRDVLAITEASRSAGGPLNYEMRISGLGAMYQASFGSAGDVVTIEKADGGVFCLVKTAYAGGTSLEVDYIPAGFPAAGKIAIAYRDQDGSLEEDLTFVTATYSSYAGNIFTLSGAISGPPPIKAEDFVFMYGDGAGGTDDLTGVYTHLFIAGTHLDSVSTFCILRDIVAFYYYDSKINQWSETYDNQAIVKGSVEVVAGDEFWAGRLAADTSVGDTSIQLDDIDNEIRDWNIFYPPGGQYTMWIHDESGIDHTGADVTGLISGIPASGDGSITQNHPLIPERQVVAPSSIPEILLVVTDPVLTAVNAGLEYRVSAFDQPLGAIEALSASVTLNNNLFTEKIPLGQRGRAALPEGRRQVTGTLHLEFDSPVEYHRVLRGTQGTLLIDVVDQLSDINDTGVRKRNMTYMPLVQPTGETPATDNTDLYEYDWNFQALGSTRLASICKIIVDEFSDALQGG